MELEEVVLKLSTHGEKETVKGIMTKRVITLPTTKKTVDALELMVEKDIGSIVVVQRGKLYGIVTERDIVKRITKDFEYLNRPLSETATKPVATITPETPVWEAFTLLLRKRIRRLPVVKNGKLIGIVTERDLFKWVVEVAYEPNVPGDIKDLVSRSR